MDVDDIRRSFVQFMTTRDHRIIERAPLVLREDPTTLFTGSGMQPLLPYLLGADHPEGARLADVQPCLRSQDIDEVGDNRHTTFFEMIGNWSLGAYFKREQITALWTFLIDIVGLDPSRLYVSVYSGDPELDVPTDEESAGIWAELFTAAGVDADRIVLDTEERGNEIGNRGARICFYRDKNWWSRGGGPADMPIGDPGGPDTEVFYYFPQVEHDTAYGAFSHPNSDGGQYLEIGNSVFMAFARGEAGLEPLSRRNVDFGGGLERIAAAALDTPDVYRVGTLWPLIVKLEEMTGLGYDDHRREMRVIADHIRGSVFLAADGVVPASKEHGYVLRRIIRRAIRFAHGLGLSDGAVSTLGGVVVEIYGEAYPDLAACADTILATLGKEERAFRRTLGKGLRELRHIAKENRTVTGDDFFTLYDRYGFPVELSSEEARSAGLDIEAGWRDGFDRCVLEQRERSRAGSKLGAR